MDYKELKSSVKNLRDTYDSNLKGVKREIEEAENKGQHNWYNKLLMREADYENFVYQLDEILKEAK